MSLREWSVDHEMVQIVNSSTRKRIVIKDSTTCLQESMIDLVFTNRPLEDDVIPFDNAFSDHDFLWIKSPDGEKREKSIKKVIRDWTHLTDNNIQRLANSKPTPSDFQELASIQRYI